MRVEFLPQAVEDIDRVFGFLVEKNPLAAAKAMLAIDEAIEKLTLSPRLGRPLPGLEDFRQIPIPFGKSGYMMQYRIQEDALVVVRLWAGREAGPPRS